MWYSIMFFRLVLLLLPTFLRKPVLVALANSLITPIDQLHDTWKANRLANIDKLSYNSQTCYLRGALNDHFDFTQRRIIIQNTAIPLSENFIFTPAEGSDVYLGTMYLEQDFSYVDDQVDFIVQVPAEIMATQSNEIIATIDFYHLAGMSYKIIEI